MRKILFKYDEEMFSYYNNEEEYKEYLEMNDLEDNDNTRAGFHYDSYEMWKMDDYNDFKEIEELKNKKIVLSNKHEETIEFTNWKEFLDYYFDNFVSNIGTIAPVLTLELNEKTGEINLFDRGHKENFIFVVDKEQEVLTEYEYDIEIEESGEVDNQDIKVIWLNDETRREELLTLKEFKKAMELQELRADIRLCEMKIKRTKEKIAELKGE